jgi:homoserine dehydrogenase
MGGGTVGGGVWELLQSNPAVSIQKIVVRSLKPRDYAAPTSLFTTDPADILENPEIDCVVEVMGGTGLAKDVVLKALQAGKSVVTANKALLAEHLTEVAEATKASDKAMMYEAAVCGGIPIINLLQTAYTGDVIQSVQGICNGTTNYMLSKMDQEGAAYDAVLKEAQDLGYAEADPTADVEGHDVRAKIALLAKLAFGTTLTPQEIPCQGISQITSTDFAFAKSMNSTIKLVGTAAALPSAVSVYVAPVLVAQSHTLAGIHGSGNAVTVTSQNMGACLFTGPGAGRFPTANSVVADILRIAAQPSFAPAPFPREASLPLQTDYTTAFYVRAVGDGLPTAALVLEWAKECGLPEPALVTAPVGETAIVVTCEACPRSQIDTLVAKFPPGCSVLAMPQMS